MNPDVVRFATFVLAGLVVVAYVLFIRWRIGVHRRREQEAGWTSSRTRSASAALGEAEDDTPVDGAADQPVAAVRRAMREEAGERAASESDPDHAGAPETVVEEDQEAPSPFPPSSPPQARHATVLEAVAGIVLPLDLVPHPDAAPLPGAADRVALVTAQVPVERLREEVGAALGAIGYEVSWAGEEGLAWRPQGELRVTLHDAPHTVMIEDRRAFPVAQAGSVVVDLWLPE